MKYLIIITILMIGLSTGYFLNNDKYFGKSDIINYQRLNIHPDIFHVNTFILQSVFGEYNFFTKIMPIIIFLIFPYTLYQIKKDWGYVYYTMLTTGLIPFYFIIGLYSQCIAHIFLNLYIAKQKSFYKYISILNHPTTLVYYFIEKKKYFLIIIPIIFTVIYFNTSVIQLTVIRDVHQRNNILIMFLLLINPLTLGNYFYSNIKNKTVYIIFFLGLLSANMRISMYVLPLITLETYEKYKNNKQKPVLFILNLIYFITIFMLHIKQIDNEIIY